jgi:outer membrane lipoprotein-sorting protein
MKLVCWHARACIALHFLLLHLTPLSADDSSDADVDFEAALVALEYQAEAIESWSMEFTKHVKFRKGPSEPFQHQVMRNIEHRLGDRFRVEQEELNAPNPDARWFEKRAFNGERQTSYEPPQKHGSVTSTEIKPSLFGRIMYVDLEPHGGPRFPGVLRKWKPVRKPTWIEKNGRRLLSLKLYSQELLCEYDILLDPSHSWQPAEYSAIRFDQPGGTIETSDWSESRYTYVEYHQEGDICVPTKRVSTVDRVSRGGMRFRAWEVTVTVDSIVLNPDLSKETFEVDFPAGTQVYDKDRGLSYTVGEPESENPVRAMLPTDPVSVARSPVAGTPPWWSDFRVWIALGAVFVAAALWWRWREKR